MEFPMSQFVSIASCPVMECLWEEPGSILFTPPQELCIYVDNSILDFGKKQKKKLCIGSYCLQ